MAAQSAGKILGKFFAHKVPSFRSDEKGGPSSPWKNRDPGRMDIAFEVQDKMGPTPPPQFKKGGFPCSRGRGTQKGVPRKFKLKFSYPSNCRHR